MSDVQIRSTQTVYVLLPVHNRYRLTQQFLSCLRAQTYPNIRLLVVDDGSEDGTAEMVQSEYEGAVILRGTGNLWWAGGLQRGIDWLGQNATADDDVILIANDDTSFDETFVESAVAFLRAHPRSLLCARVTDPQTGNAGESGVHADFLKFSFRTAHFAGEINCLPTRGLFLYWSDMERVGGFHPRLLPHYWSDYEYTIRAFRLGYRCLTDAAITLRSNPEATGFHDLDRFVGWRFVRHFFSVKSPLNPWYRSVFVWLAAPGACKVIGLFNVWGRGLPRLVWQGIVRRPYPRARLNSRGGSCSGEA